MSAVMEREIDSKAFGRISVSDRQCIHFPRGLYGFEHLRSFALIDAERPPFYWLQSVEQVDAAFILVDPVLVARDYTLQVAPVELETIGNPPRDRILVFAIVTIPQDGSRIRCNLQGPIIVNRDELFGCQAISLDPRWKLRHHLAVER